MSTPTAWAELKLPSGSRPPNVSLDPFERAREAIKELPRTEPAPQPAQTRPTTTQAPIRTDAPAVTDTATATTADEPAATFSQEASFTLDWIAKTTGGIVPEAGADPAEDPGSSALIGLANYFAEIDTGGLGLWQNGRLFLNLTYNFGNSPGDFIGDFHGVSGNDAGDTSFKIYELAYEHSFEHSHSALQVGLFDWNADFYVSEYAGLFLNGAPGMGTVVGTGGALAFPLTSVGLRLKTELSERAYIMISAQDADPGAETDIANFSFSKSQGVFGAVEFGLTKGEPGDSEGYYKLAAGSWYTTVPVNGFAGVEDDEMHPNGVDPLVYNDGNIRPDNGGMYFVAETSIGETLGLFGKAGLASPVMNRYPQFYTAGLNYTGLIPGRPDDVTGLAVIITNQSADFLALNPADAQNNGFFSKEAVYELTYSTQITDWLMVQPDFQYILQPGMNTTIGNAVVIGMRVAISL